MNISKDKRKSYEECINIKNIKNHRNILSSVDSVTKIQKE